MRKVELKGHNNNLANYCLNQIELIKLYDRLIKDKYQVSFEDFLKILNKLK